MYRVRSAPANLCMMSHRKKPSTSAKESANMPILFFKSESESKQIVLGEVVTDIANDIKISDPTEQLVLFNIIRLIIQWEHYDNELRTMISKICQRIIASFISHQIMIIFVGFLHHLHTRELLHSLEHTSPHWLIH